MLIATIPAKRIIRSESSTWRSAWSQGLVTWAICLAAYTSITLFSQRLPYRDDLRAYGTTGMYRLWGQWDGGWYQYLADLGYDHMPAALSDRAPAFYPLYPALMALADPVLPRGVTFAGQVVSALALLGLFVVFFRLMQTEFSEEVAGRGVWLMMAFPSGFFLLAGYNMSLLLLLVVSSVLAMRRGHWWLAGLLGGFAVLTRPSGLVLVLPFAYEYFRQVGRFRLSLLWIGLIPSGLAAYMAYCAVVLGDPFAPRHAQVLWARQLDWPMSPVWQAATQIFRTDPMERLENLYSLGAVVFMGSLVILGFIGPWRFRRDQMAFALTGLGLWLFSLSFPVNGSLPLFSSVRYVLEIFPAFIVLARITSNVIAERAYLLPALTLQGFFLVQFLHGDWVA